MDLQTIADAFSESFSNVGTYVSNVVPVLILAIIIAFVGWALGSFVGKYVAQGINSVRAITNTVDAILGESFRRAGMNLNFGKFIGTLVELFIIIVFAVVALDLLGLNAINDFLSQVLAYIPRIIIATAIIGVAAFVAEIVEEVVVGATRATKLKSAKFAGLIAKWAIWIFAILEAVQQLGISLAFINGLYNGLILTVSIALGLAFGFGGRNAAEKFVDKVFELR